jgi:16S rRNA (adenine1518-N6/adenine1519-N6)-dimethyltransferase
MARQRLGQHFLGDAGWRRRILETLPRHAGETWVEIGAGHGEMTEVLAGDGRRVIAIETDAQLAERLRERVSGEPADWPGVEVVSADVLHADLGKLAGGRFRVYGNLPYYITSPILHHLFRWADRIDSIHIVIQLEVAARIAARSGRREYGYLSAACQFYAKPEIVMRIPPAAAASDVSARADDAAGRARWPRNHRRAALPRIRAALLRPEAQDAAQQLASCGARPVDRRAHS